MEKGKDIPSISFFTDTGIDVPSVTEAGMREVDRIAVEETGPNLYQMMENAGRNLALQAIDMLGEKWQSASIVVLAGTGGNGGGGICAARHLANRGAKVKLVVSNAERLGEVPSFQYEIYKNTGSRALKLSGLGDGTPGLIIDALIGYSLKSAPYGAVLQMINWANSTESPVLSLDIPSGIDSTTGESPGEYINTKCTMTLALPKTGLLPGTTGGLFLADIGIPAATYERLGLGYVPPFGDRYVVPLLHK
jgi:NAD(P)H-hydrate epimerase